MSPFADFYEYRYAKLTQYNASDTACKSH